MADYLISGDVMTSLADNARRLAGKEDKLNAAEILEVMSRTDGSVDTSSEDSVISTDGASEYLIQDTTMTDMANQMRRLSGTTDPLNAFEVAEMFSKTQGTVKTTGAYEVKAMTLRDSTCVPLKDGMYDTGEVFALPNATDIDETFVLQGWTYTSEFNNNYVVVKDRPIWASPIYRHVDDALVITLSGIPAELEVKIRLTNSSQLSIDWGDGVVTDNTASPSHVYSTAGDYQISIHGGAKPFYDIGDNGGGSCYVVDVQSAPFVTSISIPKSATVIGNWFCKDYSSLNSVDIAIGAERFGFGVFYNCKSLKNICIPTSTTALGNYMFYQCHGLETIVLPYNLAEIPTGCFDSCSSLAELILPSLLTSIGDYAFRACSALTDVNIPEGVTSIGDSTFYNCSALTSVKLPDNVTSIGNSAFYNCSALTDVNIPEGVTSIGDYAFTCLNDYSTQSETITFPETITSIGKCVFGKRVVKNIVILTDEVCPTEGDLFCESLYSDPAGAISAYAEKINGIYVPDDLVESYIADPVWSAYAVMFKPLSQYQQTQRQRFIQFCEGTLTELLPEDFGDATVVPDWCLYGYSGKIQYIEFPDNITQIGTTVAYETMNLQISNSLEVVFPANLTTFKGIVFCCAGSGSVIYDFSKVTQIPTLAARAADGTTNYSSCFTKASEIRVPSALYDTWKTSSGWSSIGTVDKIVAV